jgi:uncharacterized membrane protein YgcG
VSDDLGFDRLDAALGERLRASQPIVGDVDSTLDGLRPRMTRARRRHRAVITAASALGVAALVGVGAVVLRPGSDAGIKTPPATRPDDAPTTRVSEPTVTTVPVTPDSGGTLGSTPPTVDDQGGGSGSSGSGSSGSGSSGSGSGSSGSGSGSGSSGSG